MLASLALHLGLLAWVVSRPKDEVPEKRPSGTFLFVEVVEPEPPPPAPEPPKPPPGPRPARPRPPADTVPPDEAPSPLESDRPTADAPVADAPRALPAPGSLGRAALLPGAGLAFSLDAGTLEETVDPGPLAPKTPEQLVSELARETLGKGRVERGLVHPYYSQLGKTLLKNWDADRVAKSGLKGLDEQFVQNSKIYNELWADRAAAYGRGGSPITGDSPTSYRGPPPNERIQGLPGVDLEARKQLAREMASAFKATRRATIRVVQDRGGKLKRVELVSPSNDAQVDKEALKDVRAAAEKLPPPPDEVVGSRQEIASLWSFELIVSISPPVPVFTFEFDEALGFIDARLPLDRRIYKKVRLVSVE